MNSGPHRRKTDNSVVAKYRGDISLTIQILTVLIVITAWTGAYSPNDRIAKIEAEQKETTRNISEMRSDVSGIKQKVDDIALYFRHSASLEIYSK